MIYSVWVVVDLMFIHLKLLFLRDLLKRSANCVGTSISVDAEVAVTIKRSLYDTIRYDTLISAISCGTLSMVLGLVLNVRH